ncbi:hypothetical protein BC831DRAFT_442347 [Entophlyctis helioformis]|nr:hypothetical protein BC831DRAFT_442347 [Entophlyctis helioformis]
MMHHPQPSGDLRATIMDDSASAFLNGLLSGSQDDPQSLPNEGAVLDQAGGLVDGNGDFERSRVDRKRDRDYGRDYNRDRGDRDHRDRDRDRRRRSRSRSLSGSRARSRSRSRDRGDRRDRDRKRDRDSRRSRSPEYSRRKRSRSREHRSSRRSSSSPGAEIAPLHLRPRKLANWDVPPSGFETVSAMDAKATGRFPLPSHLLRGPPQPGASHHYDPSSAGGLHMQQPQAQWDMPPPGQRPGFNGRQASAGGPRDFAGAPFPGRDDNNPLNSTLVRQAKRLYVGNIPPTCSEDRIVAFMSASYEQLPVPKDPGDAAVNAHVKADRGYAFVEFRTPEEAARALALDGVVFEGQTLRVRRPKDFNPDILKGILPPPSITPPSIIESPDKIFIGAIPIYLTDDQLQDLLRAFGELKSFSLIRDSQTGVSKGFAFCEYTDSEVTDVACSGLNGMELGEKKLVVQRANAGGHRAARAAMGASGDGGMTGYGSAGAMSGSLTGDILSRISSAPASDPTRILLLLNMVTIDELISKTEYEDILLDVQDEAAKFGKVERIVIPRPIDGRDGPGVGKIFVKYSEADEAAAAQRALAGRKFAERTVVASFFDEEKFERSEF